MGYDSRFSGTLTPNKPIPEDLVKRINDADLDVRVSDGTDDCGGEPGDIVPWASSMHGYDWVSAIVKVQRLLSKHGIALSGDIARAGEDGDDFDKVEVRKGSVYYRPGYIAYGKREPCGVEQVTHYAVRKMATSPAKTPVGWVSATGLGELLEIVEPDTLDGRPVVDRPPLTASWFSDRKEAESLRAKMRRSDKDKTTKYEVVGWEDAI